MSVASSHVLALAAVLRVAPAWAAGARGSARVPVDAHHGVLDAVGGEGALLVREGERSGEGLRQRFERLAVALHLPGVQLLEVVLPVILIWPYPDSLAVFDIHKALAAASQQTSHGEVLDRDLVDADVYPLSFLVCHRDHHPFGVDWTERQPAAGRSRTPWRAVSAGVQPK
jgi:hypothetical protein